MDFGWEDEPDENTRKCEYRIFIGSIIFMAVAFAGIVIYAFAHFYGLV